MIWIFLITGWKNWNIPKGSVCTLKGVLIGFVIQAGYKVTKITKRTLCTCTSVLQRHNVGYFSPKNVQHLIKHAKFLILHFNHIAKDGLNDMKYFFLERGKNMF